MSRAETAPETGEVDEQVCSVGLATEEMKEHKSERQNSDEEAIDWVQECMDGCGDEFITVPSGPETHETEMHNERRDELR